MKWKYVERFVEFFFIGFLLGIIEDIIAIKAATGAVITWNTVVIAAIVALPFAIFSELIVDRKHFFDFIKKLLKIKNAKK